MGATLACWFLEPPGLDRIEKTLKALENRRIGVDRAVLLRGAGTPGIGQARIGRVKLEPLVVPVADLTAHQGVYEALRADVLPKLAAIPDLHLDLAPGTPETHAVWLLLQAGGELPPGARAWISRESAATGRTRLDPLDFVPSSWLARATKAARERTREAAYDPYPRSGARREAIERLMRCGRVRHVPLLVLGERGTGKSRLLRTLVPMAMDCAVGAVRIVDDVHELRPEEQRALLAELERDPPAHLAAASGLTLAELRARLLPGLFDALTALVIEVPPLRRCRDDLLDDWRRVWGELGVAGPAPWSPALDQALTTHPLPGNLRDLRRLAAQTVAAMGQGLGAHSPEGALDKVVGPWLTGATPAPTVGAEGERFGAGTRADRQRWFLAGLARHTYAAHGTWPAAAEALSCAARTLREDAKGWPEGG